MATAALTLDSVFQLPSRAHAPGANSGHTLGCSLPRLGLGVFQNAEAKPAVRAALEKGYRYIDTARMYGNITPKAIDDSLEQLGLGTPLSGKENRLQAYKALVAARNMGKVHNIGVSNYGVKHLEEIREGGLELLAVNQIELHPFCQQKDIVDYCREHGIVVEAYSPLIRGNWNEAIVDIGKKYSKDPAQILIRWSLQRGYVPLPKSANPNRVVSNADVFDFEISPEDMKTLDALDRGKDGAVTWNPIDAL